MFNHVVFNTPFLRVNNRNMNIAFYEKNLGMRLTYEENALTILTGWENRDRQFIIEESPSMRTREAAGGIKKLKRLVIKADAKEIESLLARGVEATQIYKGANGYAYEVISPEKDLILLHAEDDLVNLVETEASDFNSLPDFQGLSDFEFSAIELNVPNGDMAAFYQDLLSQGLPLNLSFYETVGEDLAIEPNITWDLEIFDFKVAKDYDLVSLKEYFEDKDVETYMDKKESILVVSDPSQIELWFSK